MVQPAERTQPGELPIQPVRDIQGIVLAGATLAVALGIAMGALLRRTLPALAITVVVSTLLRLVIGQDLRVRIT